MKATPKKPKKTTAVRVRRKWRINPVTRVKESAKAYRRAKARREAPGCEPID